MFKRICIIGCGLIGSSIARGIKKNKIATKVVSSNRSNSTNKKVIRLKIVDEASSDTKKIVKGSDLIIIASPLSSYKNIILKIKSSLKNGAILTDVGSVKKDIISLRNIFLIQLCFWYLNFVKRALTQCKKFLKCSLSRCIC